MKIVKKKMITNDKAPKTIYGHKIKAIDGNVNALSHFNNDLHLNNGKTQIRMELIRTNLPEKRDAIKYTYSKNGVSSFEIKPLLAVRDDDAFDSEEKLSFNFRKWLLTVILINRRGVFSLFHKRKSKCVFIRFNAYPYWRHKINVIEKGNACDK